MAAMPPSRVGGSQRLCHHANRPIVLVCTELPSLRVQSPPHNTRTPLRTHFTDHGFVLGFLGVVHVVDRLLSRGHGVLRGDDHGGAAGLGPPSGH